MKQTIKEKYNLDDSYELIYTDHNDYFEKKEEIERIVQEGNADFIYETNDWLFDSKYESIRNIIEELEKEHGEISKEDKEEIEEYLEEHDNSNPIKDIIKHTPSQYFYYSLGFSDPGMELEGGEHDELRVKKIEKFFNTPNRELAKTIREVVVNSGYGGEVVILFEEKLENLLNNGNVIEFGPKAELCIMDRMQGSGHSAELGTKIVCKFIRTSLHADNGAPGYSFADDVCGLTRGFMSGATIRKKKENDRVLNITIDEKTVEKMKKEKELEEKWQTTKQCTFGDMKFKRHAKTEYINDFPCGNKCHDCGTFWID